MKTDQPLFLSEDQVREHLRMADLIPAMEKALIEFHWSILTTNSHEWTRIWFFH